jgi:hypothetical protein
MGHVEDLAESGDRLIDLPRRQPALSLPPLPVAVDLRNRDLPQEVIAEMRQ